MAAPDAAKVMAARACRFLFDGVYLPLLFRFDMVIFSPSVLNRDLELDVLTIRSL